ncbi:MAG: hypothetical protein QM820_64020 [Minicystis sp.]
MRFEWLVIAGLVGLVGCGGGVSVCTGAETCDPTGFSGGDPTKIAEIALGWGHTCTRDGAGTVRCAGSNANGQLGNGEATSYPTDGVAEPIVVPLAEPARQIAASGSLTCALTSEVDCWGNDGSGSLGLAATADKPSPTRVEGIDGARVVSIHVGGSSNGCALLDDGSARCWGNNESGQVSPGAGTYYFPAAIPAPISGIRQLALGGTFTCALTNDGAVMCWGCTWKAEGGNDYCTPPEPLPIADLGEVRAIAAGRGHACALRADGALWCWGLNMWQELGDGTWTTRPTAAPVLSVSDVASLALGWDHTCAVTSQHEAICWGANAFGATGNGMQGVSAAPATALDRVKTIAGGGGGHTCAIRQDGTAWCWGWNPYGQIGDGTREDRLVPVPMLPP